MIRLWTWYITNLNMRLFFFLTPSLIGSTNDRILIITNQQVVLIGLRKTLELIEIVNCHEHETIAFLTPSVIGTINDRILILTNQQVVLIGLRKTMVNWNSKLPCLFCKLSIKSRPIICIYSVDLEVWSKLAKHAHIKRIESNFAHNFDSDCAACKHVFPLPYSETCSPSANYLFLRYKSASSCCYGM